MQISKFSIQEEKYAASKNFFKFKKWTWWNSAIKTIEIINQNEAANLIVEFNKKFKSSEAAKLIYKIIFAVKKEIFISKIL